jgi:cyclophilin family peptidyl-prolyl cis-trans isomerase/HEAT repeat protein
MKAQAWFLVLVLVAACGGARGRPEAVQPPLDATPSRVAFSEAPELAEIAQLEYSRDLGGGRLIALLGNGTPEVRRRAALALGRFLYPDFGAEVTEALVKALEDDDPYVRRTAAFGLGQRADQVAGGVLAAYRNDADPELRVRVAEASRQLRDEGLRGEVILALRDDHLEVRIAAVLAMALWDTEAPPPAEVDRALLDLLLPHQGTGTDHGSDLAPLAPPGVEVDPELRWRTLYALERRKAPLGRNAFLVFARSELPLERIFAVRGLAALEPDPEIAAELAFAAADPDWRVAVEAMVGLSRQASEKALEALLDAAGNPSPHVRRSALEALAAFPNPERVASALTRGARDVSSSVQAAALGALARVLSPQDAREQLEGRARDEDAVVRAGVAEGAAKLPSPHARPLLLMLAKDSDRRVAGLAIEGLGKHLDAEVRGFLHVVLSHPDNGLKLAAVTALGEAPEAGDAAPLIAAVQGATGDIAPEVGFNALRVLGKIGGEAAQNAVSAALGHPDRYVRRVAREVLAANFPAAPATDAVTSAAANALVPLPGRDFPLYERNPAVEIQTTRGTLLFELFPTEAPVHVHNFLKLAESGHYDGLNFHRVVPDFVVQGGDYRGDGNGSRSWNEHALPQEFTTRRYVRGSLGMPRNENPDSGGSQFFITHRPTPHLDGRYTLFGELRGGGDVLDRIEVGDRILAVRLR